MQMPAEISKIFVRPRRSGLPVQARLRVIAVPAKTKAVTIGPGSRFQGPEALGDQRMLGMHDVMFEGGGFTSVSNPAAHSGSPLLRPTPGEVNDGLKALKAVDSPTSEAAGNFARCSAAGCCDYSRCKENARPASELRS